MKAVPFFHFAFSKDFNYRKYLEQKSHVSEIVQAVDRGILDHAYSIERLGHQIVSASEKNNNLNAQLGIRLAHLQDTVGIGFAKVDNTLQDLSDAVSYQTLVLQDGISGLSQGLSEIDDQLKEIRFHLENQELSWEYERYRRAKQAADNLLAEEALSELNMAIYGHGSHPGNKLDYRFHYLKGHCLMGCPPAEIIETLNLPEALKAFDLAARYAVLEKSKADFVVAYCLTKSAWVSYLLGDFKAAEERIGRAWGKAQYPELAFIAAKTCLAQDKIDRAEPYLYFCIFSEPASVARMSADPDFIRHRSVVIKITEKIRSIFASHAVETFSLFDSALHIINGAGVLSSFAKVKGLKEYKGGVDAVNHIEALRGRRQNAIKADLLSFSEFFNPNFYAGFLSDLKSIKRSLDEFSERERTESVEYKRLQSLNGKIADEKRKLKNTDLSLGLFLAIPMVIPVNIAFALYSWLVAGEFGSGFLAFFEFILALVLMPIAVFFHPNDYFPVIYFISLLSFWIFFAFSSVVSGWRLSRLGSIARRTEKKTPDFLIKERAAVKNAIDLVSEHESYWARLQKQFLNHNVPEFQAEHIVWRR